MNQINGLRSEEMSEFQQLFKIWKCGPDLVPPKVQLCVSLGELSYKEDNARAPLVCAELYHYGSITLANLKQHYDTPDNSQYSQKLILIFIQCISWSSIYRVILLW